ISSMNCLVIGGTQFIGRQLVADLLKAGHAVTVLHRRPKHDLGRRVKNITADRNDPQAIKSALAGTKFEVVFDHVYDWERGTTAAQVEGTVRAAGNHLHRYIFMSSVAAYGDGLNHHEGDALAPDDAPELYVRNKAMSERALFRLHQRIGLPVVTVRPPYVYGPGHAARGGGAGRRGTRVQYRESASHFAGRSGGSVRQSVPETGKFRPDS